MPELKRTALLPTSPRGRDRWLLAVLPPLVVLLIQWTTYDLMRPYAWFLFLPAVAASSWIGGLRGGLLATVLSAVLVWWFFIPPAQAFAKHPPSIVSGVVFLATGALIAMFERRLRRANERLRQLSHERRMFAALVENSSDFIGIADTAGVLVYVNPAGRRMVGLPADIAVNETQIADYYAPEQRSFATDVIVKSVREQGQWQGHTAFRHWTTGANIPVSDARFMIRDRETAATLGIGTITRDVAALERAREIEARMASLVEQAPEGIFVADLDGRYIDVNDAGCRLLGYTREELLGMSIVDLLRPEDVPRLAQDKTQLLGGEVATNEWRLVRKDGTEVHVEITAKILPDGRWQAFVRDITERRELETALQVKSADLERAQSVAQVGSWRLDVQRNEVHCSEEEARIFEIPTGVPMSYESFLARVHPDDREYVDRMWSAAQKGAPYDIEHRVVVGGKTKWVREKIDLEFDERGMPLSGVGITQDITRRKQLEADVHDAQERFELALEGAGLAAWDWNVQSGEVVFNARWAEMRGYRPEEVAPTVESWKSGVHPDDWPRVQQVLGDYLAGRLPEYQTEHRVRTKTGEWIWILDRGKVFARDERGQPSRMAGTELDITGRKRAEEELRRAHARSSGIMAVSADAIISVDSDQHITMFNEGAERIFGYAKTEVIGKPLHILLPERSRSIHAQHVARLAAGPDVAHRMAVGTSTINGLRKDGREFPADATISKLEVDGELILTVTIRDISEQKRVELEQTFLADVGLVLATSLELEETLSKIAALAVRDFADFCVIDLRDEQDDVRRAAAVCRDPSKSWICDELMHVALDRTHRYLTADAIWTGQSVLIDDLSDETINAFTQSELHREVLHAAEPKSLIAVPLVAYGKLLGGIGFLSSTRTFGPADLRVAEELGRRAAPAIENAQLYGLAQRAIKARDDVLGIVVHDLRSPLHGIGLQAELMAEGGNEQGRKAARLIHKAARRMNRLIQDILDVTRLDARRLAVERSVVSTRETLDALVDAQRPLAKAKQLDLNVELADDVPDVWGDRDRLLQIFENLIGNALKFTKRGGVTIGATPRDDEVLFWVRDTGVGMPADELAHVFDRFWQGRKEARSGAGLGLAIVKGLVEAHAGRVWVESTLGLGTCFYFTIPVAHRPPWQEAAHATMGS